MKKSVLIFSWALLVLVGCSSTYQAASAYDDVYYNPDSKTRPAVEFAGAAVTETSPEYIAPVTTGAPQASGNDEPVAADAGQEETWRSYTEDDAYAPSETYSDPQGDTYNYYNDDGYLDDYYDYSYAARIRRFHGSGLGFGYYDPYYTNMYWYNYDPWCWGSSIYMGYNWWYPSWYYRPSFYFGLGWDFGFFSLGWGYNDWYWGWPYYGWGGYGLGYHHGYWDGFWHGYWAGNYGEYYNSYDYNSYYYGHRPSRGSYHGGAGNGQGRNSFGEHYEHALNIGRGDRNTGLNVAGDNRNDVTVNPGYNRNQTHPNDIHPDQNKNVVAAPRNDVNNNTPGSEAKPRYSYSDLNKNKAGNVTPSNNDQPKRSGLDQPAVNNDVNTGTRGNSEINPQPGLSSSERQGVNNQQPKYQSKPQPKYSYRKPESNNQNNNSKGSTASEKYSNMNGSQMRYSEPKQYTSPSNNKPKSSQEYTSPKPRSTESGIYNRTYDKPSSGNNTYQRSNTNSRPNYPSSGSEIRKQNPSSSSGNRSTYSPSTRSGNNSGNRSTYTPSPRSSNSVSTPRSSSGSGNRSSSSSSSSGSGSRGRR